jgi:hypothetical protein
VAAELQKALGITAELVVGGSGEFTVWVDGAKVAEKKWMFPEPSAVVAAVRAAGQRDPQ